MWGDTENLPLIFSNFGIFSCDFFFFKCELMVPVKIGFVTVYLVMNYFLVITHWRHQEISCFLLRNPWTLWILNAHQHDFLLIGGTVAPLFFYQRPNYGGNNEDNGDLLQKLPWMHCHTQCPRPCSRLPLTHTSTGNPWALTGKSRSVSCGVTAPLSWVLMSPRFCLCPPRVCFPSTVEVL